MWDPMSQELHVFQNNTVLVSTSPTKIGYIREGFSNALHSAPE